MKPTLKLSELLANEQFLNHGATLKETGHGLQWLVRDRKGGADVLYNVTRAIGALKRRHALKFDKHPKNPAVFGGLEVATIEAGFCFLITPSCHGNGGWCGSTTHRAGTLAALLKLHSHRLGIAGDGMFGDDRPRICVRNDVNSKTLAIWDRDEGVWNDNQGVPLYFPASGVRLKLGMAAALA